MWAKVTQNRENFKFLVKKICPLAIFRKLGVGGSLLHRAKFTIVALEMWAYVCQNRQTMERLVKYAPKGPIRLCDFYKIWNGEGVLGTHPHANFTAVALKIWLTAPKSPKLIIFSTNFP